MRARPSIWLVTGVAGFIGSNLLETLLGLDQRVRGLDNYFTGHKKNLEQVQGLVGEKQWSRFQMIEGDIRDPAACRRACEGVDFVLHQAALGSVPRSLAEPVASHESNVTGFLNMLIAARDAGTKQFVFASSSAVYGDAPELPKVEDRTGKPLSPYAASKMMNELYASAFARSYGFHSIGLRYFNVFGPRQDPEGAYAAVIPKWIAAMLRREPVYINGDGETSRDFCYINNVVQANLLAATAEKAEALDQAYNIALGERTTLNELFLMLQTSIRMRKPELRETKPVYREFRPGDVRHSLADIGKAQGLLGYAPEYKVQQGIELAMDWYMKESVKRETES
ncbi:MAG: LPS biosynthesis protein WbpP [Verrucomicrobia bacterium]|nr:MAG: LPS biosynthesis protein WbpP [Verrucomicrobiota bacterium]